VQTITKDQLLPPGICTLCESAPSEDQDTVDTLKELVTGFPFKLQGRKYVCSPCIVALGNVIGLVSSEQAEKAEARAEVAEARLNAVRDHVAVFAAQIEPAALDAAANVYVAPEPVVVEEPVAPAEPEVADEPAADVPVKE
jgi:hypothetical protein